MAARFILYHPARTRGQRSKFFVKDGQTGLLIKADDGSDWFSYKRAEAEAKQKELNAPQAAAA